MVVTALVFFLAVLAVAVAVDALAAAFFGFFALGLALGAESVSSSLAAFLFEGLAFFGVVWPFTLDRTGEAPVSLLGSSSSFFLEDDNNNRVEDRDMMIVRSRRWNAREGQ